MVELTGDACWRRFARSVRPAAAFANLAAVSFAFLLDEVEGTAATGAAALFLVLFAEDLDTFVATAAGGATFRTLAAFGLDLIDDTEDVAVAAVLEVERDGLDLLRFCCGLRLRFEFRFRFISCSSSLYNDTSSPSGCSSVRESSIGVASPFSTAIALVKILSVRSRSDGGSRYFPLSLRSRFKFVRIQSKSVWS